MMAAPGAASEKARMRRCASARVIAAYAKVRLIPRVSRALPAGFLRSRQDDPYEIPIPFVTGMQDNK
jgi:hypothetical protein